MEHVEGQCSHVCVRHGNKRQFHDRWGEHQNKKIQMVKATEVQVLQL